MDLNQLKEYDFPLYPQTRWLHGHLEQEVYRRDKVVREMTQVALKKMKNIENCMWITKWYIYIYKTVEKTLLFVFT